MIAIAVPAIPIVPIRSLRDFVLRGATIAAHGSHISCAKLCASVWSRNLGLALPHDDDRVPVRMHFDAKDSVMMRGVNRNVRSINLRLCFAVFGDNVIRNALAQLHLNLFVREFDDVDLCVRSQAKRVGEVQLQLSARVVAGRYLVATHNRLVQYDC
jgi:hypothetical protein